MFKQLQQIIKKRCKVKTQYKKGRWDNSPLAEYIRQKELILLEQHIPNLFGYNIVQIEKGYGINGLNYSRISNKILIQESRSVLTEEKHYLVISKSSITPIATDSIDVVILPHTLEYEADPHHLLREVDRILIPEGHLIILGHDPLSMWGFRKLFRCSNKCYPWSNRFYTKRRIEDWMGLLGFDVKHIEPYLFFPPIQKLVNFAWVKKFDSVCKTYLPFTNGANLYITQKRVSTLTPVKSRWHLKKAIVSVDLSGSATRRDQS
jgi:SAM-dependent methyltransferase